MSMIQNIFRGNIVTIIVLYVCLGCFLVFSSPYNLPAPMLFLPFLLFFVATFLLVYKIGLLLARRSHLGLKPHHVARAGVFVAGLPTVLVLLQSIGQVSGYDVVISLVLFSALDFYLSRSRFGLFRSRR